MAEHYQSGKDFQRGYCELGECNVDADCDDLVFCNGAETCLDNSCQAGLEPCVDPAHCDEVGDVCLECVSDAECDDGLFCTGVETCVEGSCAAGALPCVDLAHCDEPGQTCLPCTDPDDDGFPCVTGQPGVCSAGTTDCQAGTLLCVPDQSPAPDDATCDSVDDDCDGGDG